MRKYFYRASLAILPLIISCNGNKGENKPSLSKTDAAAEKQFDDNQKQIDKLNHDYPKVPEDDKMLEHNGATSPVYAEMKGRYKDYMAKLKQEIEGTGAKFVVVILRQPEGYGGDPKPLNSVYGTPYIIETCKQLGVECVDLSPKVNQQDPKKITQVPRDGHWNKKGGIYVASLLAPIIEKYSSNKAKTTYKDSERPETFGDLPPHDDRILDGGKDMPYHLQANAQGLRMAQDVVFPKTKQHVLFMGGSQIYSPFLDNDFIATSVLQKQFPDKVIMNSGIIAATLDDYLTLWEEKAKYSEPDLVILQTNAGDITDLFFTNRNHLARAHKPYFPSPVEEKYYNNFLAK